MQRTIFESYNALKKQLADRGVEDYAFEARQILRHVTGYSSAQILSNWQQTLSEFQENLITAIVKQRAAHYPLQYILGSWSFYGRKYFVGPGVLIPRSDTETLVDKALAVLKDNPSPEILDLCAGSGCIGITLAAEKTDGFVTLLEKYEAAISYLLKNIHENDVPNTRVVTGDVFESAAADRMYDIIVSNPPYIKPEGMASLQKEVTFEPDTALYGGEDGLMFYRAIAKNYKPCLKSGGVLMLETGFDEAEDVKNILLENGYTDISSAEDAAGIQRVVFGTAKNI